MNKNQTLTKHHLHFIYKFWSKRYDKYVDPRWKFDRQKAIDSLQIKTGEQILEIGVGTGLNLPYYPAGCMVTGIDISEEMLKMAAQKKVPANVKLIPADAKKLSFPDYSFDKALMTYMLRVSPQPQQVLQEVSRVVKKGGLLCIVDRFKGKSIFSWLQNPFFFLIGGGWSYDIRQLITKTSWKKIHDEPFGIKRNTRLIVLKND